MAAKVGLNFQLTASVTRFEKAMARVERRLDALDRGGRKAAAGIATLKNLAIGGAAIKGITTLTGALRGASNAVTGFFGNIAKEADATAKLAGAIGINTSALQTFQVVASRAGIGPEELSSALRKVTQRIGEAKLGVGEASKTFAALGINLEALGQQAPDKQFLTIARAIATIPDSATKSALAVKLFEETGVKFLPLLNTLGTSFSVVKGELDALGIGLTAIQFKNIEQLNDKVDTLRRTLGLIGGGGIGGQLLGNIAPFFENLIDQLLAAVKAFEFAGEVGGTAVANYITEAFFRGAILIGDFADTLYSKLVQAFTFLAALVEKLAGIFKYIAPESVSEEGRQLEKKRNAEREKARQAQVMLDRGSFGGVPISAEDKADIAKSKRQSEKQAEAFEQQRKEADAKFIRQRYGIGDPKQAVGVGGAARLAGKMFVESQINNAKTPEQVRGALDMADRLGVDTDAQGRMVGDAEKRKAARRQLATDRLAAIKVEQAQAERQAKKEAEEARQKPLRERAAQAMRLNQGLLQDAKGTAARDQVLADMRSQGFDLGKPLFTQGRAGQAVEQQLARAMERFDPAMQPLFQRQDALAERKAKAQARVDAFERQQRSNILDPQIAAGKLKADLAVASGAMTREDADAKVERDVNTLRENFARKLAPAIEQFRENAFKGIERLEQKLQKDFEAARQKPRGAAGVDGQQPIKDAEVARNRENFARKLAPAIEQFSQNAFKGIGRLEQKLQKDFETARQRPQPRGAAGVDGQQPIKDGEVARNTAETNRLLDRGLSAIERKLNFVQVGIV